MDTNSDMRASVFFEGAEMSTKLSRFWLLLCLASVIAAAGVVADSAATVIGAMIVAPLMMPILGIVGDDHRGSTNLLVSWALVGAGAARRRHRLPRRAHGRRARHRRDEQPGRAARLAD